MPNFSLRRGLRSAPAFAAVAVLATTMGVATATASPAAPVSHTLALSKAQTGHTMDIFMGARKTLAARGITVTGVEMNFKDPGHVHVNVSKTPTASQARTLRALAPLGSGSVTIAVKPAPVITGQRFADNSPWTGGDRINSANGPYRTGGTGPGLCTSGFGTLSAGNGRRYMITAYHCVRANDPRVWQNGTLVGTASVLDPADDMAFIPVSGTRPYVWTGPLNYVGVDKQVTKVQHPKAPGPDGPPDAVCTLGASSGSRCGIIVGGYGHYNLCTMWTDESCYDAVLWYGTQASGNLAVTGGDSGGPVVIATGDTVTAYGIISARGGTELTQGCDCSDTVYFGDVYTAGGINHQLIFIE